MNTLDTLITLALSLGLGLLVGLQRERKGEPLAGIRTFALITLLGTICALVGQEYGTWMVPAGALALTSLLAVGGVIKSRLPGKHDDIGLTTEVAAIIMFAIGAYLPHGDQRIAVIVGGLVALILHWKGALHRFVHKMGDHDLSGIMQFVLVALVIFPILPNQNMGPYNVLNPYKIWLVVVFIVGMSLGGYVLSKLLPPSVGSLVGGAVGGLVSSTATTVSYARRSKENPDAWPFALQAIMTANTVSILRVIVLLALFARASFRALAIPIGLMAAAMALITVFTFFIRKRDGQHMGKDGGGNPAELKSALTFGALYALVKLGTAWGKATFGAGALYAIGALSGLTDMDAITLSISEMTQRAAGVATATAAATTAEAATAPSGGNVAAETVTTTVAWRVIIIAICSNLVFKGGTVLSLATGPLKRWTLITFAAALAAGAGIIFLYPR